MDGSHKNEINHFSEFLTKIRGKSRVTLVQKLPNLQMEKLEFGRSQCLEFVRHWWRWCGGCRTVLVRRWRAIRCQSILPGNLTASFCHRMGCNNIARSYSLQSQAAAPRLRQGARNSRAFDSGSTCSNRPARLRLCGGRSRLHWPPGSLSSPDFVFGMLSSREYAYIRRPR